MEYRVATSSSNPVHYGQEYWITTTVPFHWYKQYQWYKVCKYLSMYHQTKFIMDSLTGFKLGASDGHHVRVTHCAST
eukprot:1253779-Rhodomonas_salina.1